MKRFLTSCIFALAFSCLFIVTAPRHTWGDDTQWNSDTQMDDLSPEQQWQMKIEKERKRLEAEIERIQKLAIGPSLSIPRKNMMIKRYQDKLDKLNESPREYFGTSTEE